MRHRDRLPQMAADRKLFIADGGLETTLIFHEGIDLPYFAAFDLLKDARGPEVVRGYFEPYLVLARERGAGFLLDTITWRANRDWAARLGYSEDALDDVIRRAVALAEEIRADHEPEVEPIVINGVIGPRGDGYVASERMSAEEAERYHARPVATFADTAVDMVTAVTMTHVEEAIGIVRAAATAELPVAISFTVETDGRLPTGQDLGDAVEQVDAETAVPPAYFMVNCAHPTHFAEVVQSGSRWLDRIGGIRANASTKSHAELDEADALDDGDPVDLGHRYLALRPYLRHAPIVGGCCGTDHRHIAAVSAAWSA